MSPQAGVEKGSTMGVAMTEAASASRQGPPSGRRRPAGTNDMSSSPLLSLQRQSTAPAKLRQHSTSNRPTGKISPPPRLTESPPSSSKGYHANKSPRGARRASSHNKPLSRVDSDRDLEASEASSVMDDESLHDFFTNNSEDELTPKKQSPARPLRVIGESLHSSLSTLQSARSTCGMLHRQGSISSLPLTVEESQFMRKRASNAAPKKILNWTGGSSTRSLQRKSAAASPLPRQSLPNPVLDTTTTTTPLLDDNKYKQHSTPSTMTNAFRTPHRHYKGTSSSVHHHHQGGRRLYTIVLVLGWILIATLATLVYYHYTTTTTTNSANPFWFPLTTVARRQARQQPILKVLLKQEGIDKERLLDPTSDAYKAMDWMANEDTAGVTSMSQVALVQRWALATLYFATHASSTEQWHNESHWMTGASTCDWYGVDCEILSQSDWFDATMGTGDSTSDAMGVLEDDEETHKQGQQDDNNKEKPTQDVVRIQLTGNNLHGTLPPEIRHLSQLMGMDLSHNHLFGTLPQGPALGHFLRLTDMKLDHNRFTGQLPPALGFNLILKQLHLGHNNFMGTIPAVWGHNLRNLRQWTMGTNFLTGKIPTTLGGLKHLQVLEWNDNQLTGPLPFSLCTVTTLKTVKLDFNSLTGSIPSEFIMSAKELEVLELGHNRLTGHVPDVMASLDLAPMMQHFHVQHNQLAGRLPKTLGHLTKMTSLRFDHNHFTGWIPMAWQRLSELTRLDLQNNKLGGTLPVQLTHLTKLEEFQFQHNLLHPTLPKKILKKLPKLRYHSIGFYTSEDRDRVLDAERADEQSRMRRQQEMSKDEPQQKQKHEPKQQQPPPPDTAVPPAKGEQEQPDPQEPEGTKPELPLLSIIDLHGGMPPGATTEHHDEEEM